MKEVHNETVMFVCVMDVTLVSFNFIWKSHVPYLAIY